MLAGGLTCGASRCSAPAWKAARPDTWAPELLQHSGVSFSPLVSTLCCLSHSRVFTLGGKKTSGTNECLNMESMKSTIHYVLGFLLGFFFFQKRWRDTRKAECLPIVACF